MMAKWVKKKVGRLVEDPYLPPLWRIGESLAISNNNEKAKILIERFSPYLALVVLSNIIGEIPVTCLRVNSNIIIEEMARTISRLLNNIVLGLDGIPNKALKTYRPLIVP